MPTSQPRYQVTDTGRTRQLIDLAAKAWPELADDRKGLLMRLAERGSADLEPAASLGEHAGRWVALRDDRVLTVGDSAGEVAAWLVEHGEGPGAVFRVPLDGEEIVSGHGS